MIKGKHKFYNLFKALSYGKRIYLCIQGFRLRLTLGSSLTQAKSKYRGWKVIGI